MSNPGLMYSVGAMPQQRVSGPPLKNLVGVMPVLNRSFLGYMLYTDYNSGVQYSDFTCKLNVDSVGGFLPGDVLQGFVPVNSSLLRIEAAVISDLVGGVREAAYMYMAGVTPALRYVSVMPGGQFSLLHTFDPGVWLLSGTGLEVS